MGKDAVDDKVAQRKRTMKGEGAAAANGLSRNTGMREGSHTQGTVTFEDQKR